MSASAIQESVCPSCGEPLPQQARFCPGCGARTDAPLPAEAWPGTDRFAHERVVRRWLGIPARFVLLCLGFAALGAAAGLFATGHWAWAIVSLVVAAAVFGALVASDGDGGRVLVEHSSRLAADGRAQAVTAAEVWRARLDTRVTRWRTQSQLDEIELAQAPALRALGDAVWRGDAKAEREARARLEELERERERAEAVLSERLAGAEERIRLARLPVDDTLMVAPDQPSEPYPPPGEADLPQPAEVPEPYPPPDEGTPPAPAPDPGEGEPE